ASATSRSNEAASSPSGCNRRRAIRRLPAGCGKLVSCADGASLFPGLRHLFTPMSTNGSQQIVQKLWNYCHVLRDDGLSYGDYVEQLTYLLFLKMAHERTQPPWNRPSAV